MHTILLTHKLQHTTCKIAHASMWSVRPSNFLREVGTREDSLRLLEGVDLTAASFLADVKIFKQPIAIGMEALDDIDGGHGFLHLGGALLSHALDGGLVVGLGALVVGDGLGILCALFSGVFHHLLILSLGILLLEISLLHLLFEVSDHGIHHRKHAIALFALLGVCSECLRRRRGSTVAVRLNEADRHTSACNATRC